ncbi:MAG: prepilin-type N-terminal cleavage/methylation domain-containing protein [bacterium]|nr:prepilin-type N-terminal cleavage/methylation domain-containing protein [bacterium]MDZ4296273.1 prepilin-type N-terminal cleavage/methylation domain-containing protein [Patescibacteria group bacterium]MDZ4296280.1 prepilin-type N-terminal cleavage/methylation domain-containing protein [Patescibacteria group bacterium]
MRRTQKAFSLIETLVAVGILAGALVAAVGLLSLTLRTMRTAQSEFIAAHLAAEGIEVIRNIRDTNWLRGVAWQTGLDDGSYAVAYDTLPPLAVYDDTQPLERDGDGRYCYNCGTETPFRRRVAIELVPVDRDNPGILGIRVTATVLWSDAAGPRSVVAQDILYNWYQ